MELTVGPLERGRIGGGVIRIDADSMSELGVDAGDYVVIEGPAGERAVATVDPGGAGAQHSRLEVGEYLRRTINADVDDRVTVEPTAVNPANEIEVALPADLAFDGAGLAFRADLVDRALLSGQIVPVSLGAESASGSSNPVPLEVTGTDPGGPVVVREWTRITVTPTTSALERSDFAGRSGDDPLTYEAVGGLDSEIERLCELVELPLRHPRVFETLGITPPTGVLLYGPPGTGKTLLARTVAEETGFHCRTLSGPALVAAYHGGTEAGLDGLVEDLRASAPALLFIDDLDAAAPERTGGSNGVERGVVAGLLSALDEIDPGDRIGVIGTTTRIDAIDPALRRPGRFGREIEISVPDRKGRKAIFDVHTRGMALAENVDLDRLAGDTHGFVGTDIVNLVTESGMNALRRHRPTIDIDSEAIDPEALASLRVTDEDCEVALGEIEPSALREVFVEVPEVAWADVGGLSAAKERLRETVQWPLAYPDAFERVALAPATGVLLYGPPGTGKTLLARAVASESASNFISIKGPELLDKYVGESEKGVREVFEKARENAPTVVFFDEIDAIAGERGTNAGDSGVGERVVSQLLTELDGLEELEDVVVVATTNRPELLDDALVRPGRLDRHVRVPVPDDEARREIFAVHTREKPLADAVALDDLAARTEGYVGADIEAVCREAATAAVREFVRGAETGENGAVMDIYLRPRHFDHAFDAVVGSETTAERFAGFGGRGEDGSLPIGTDD
jgi:transitional endoplasmic reticulum ATPase